MLNYDLLPEHLREGMKGYIERGEEPGSFLTTVICDKLVGSFAEADHISTTNMFNIAKFMYLEAPALCRGSKDEMNKWINHHKIKKERKYE